MLVGFGLAEEGIFARFIVAVVGAGFLVWITRQFEKGVAKLSRRFSFVIKAVLDTEKQRPKDDDETERDGEITTRWSQKQACCT